MVLVGFSGEVKHTLGEIELPVWAEEVNKYTRFCVLEGPSSFNAILGRPWLHEMKAVPSTYHQVMKFPTKTGVKQIKGDQAVARACYANGLKPHNAPS